MPVERRCLSHIQYILCRAPELDVYPPNGQGAQIDAPEKQLTSEKIHNNDDGGGLRYTSASGYNSYTGSVTRRH